MYVCMCLSIYVAIRRPCVYSACTNINFDVHDQFHLEMIVNMKVIILDQGAS